MKQALAAPAWLRRLLPPDGTDQDGPDHDRTGRGRSELSPRARRAREDAQRWLEARQAEHAEQLLARLDHAEPDGG